ncbi:hypothetical protein BDN71DRAFT_1451572 [Pleurotus eryngii]|uniref:SMODS and SLOG-associating 2TM effector domain-containing protein n=1 Tax=Pleurotus eryngii TaxID=5323 RepID=A0A9P5ZR07_PLEER|nr:hypothetical protein BDN71DRAFT_1451572 [Pleurotus eryngii]
MDHGQDHATQREQAIQPIVPPTAAASEQGGAEQLAGTRVPSQSHFLGQTASPTQSQPQADRLQPERPRPILLPSTIPQAPLQDDNNLNPAINRGDEPLPTARNVPPGEGLDEHSLRDSSPGHRVDQPKPVYPRYAQRLADPGLSRANSRRSGVDWIVPVEERKELPPRPKTLGERLQKTIDHANAECEKYAVRAKLTAYALNIAIGMQVLLGALTTAVSAATSGRSTSIATSVLGGLATLVASYLARARGSNEPELSITRVKDLEHFKRECEAFIMDHGHKIEETGPLVDKMNNLRYKFEDLLGNASG